MSLFSSLLGPFVSADNILRTCGAVVSIVTSTRPVLGQMAEGSKRHLEFGTVCLASKSTKTYPTGIPYLQAFFRVALRDIDVQVSCIYMASIQDKTLANGSVVFSFRNPLNARLDHVQDHPERKLETALLFLNRKCRQKFP